MKNTASFLCGNCNRVMCEDCKSIAEEYEHLLQIRTRELIAAQDRLEEKQIELDVMKRRADMFEKISKCAIPEVIIAWIDKDINQLLKVKA